MNELLRTIQANPEAAYGVALFIVIVAAIGGTTLVNVIAAWRGR